MSSNANLGDVGSNTIAPPAPAAAPAAAVVLLLLLLPRRPVVVEEEGEGRQCRWSCSQCLFLGCWRVGVV